jgi:hypothetical protein
MPLSKSHVKGRIFLSREGAYHVCGSSNKFAIMYVWSSKGGFVASYKGVSTKAIMLKEDDTRTFRPPRKHVGDLLVAVFPLVQRSH